MKCTALIAALVAMTVTGPMAMAENAPAGPDAAKPDITIGWAQKTFKNTCSSCHGENGATPVNLPGNPPPVIAGQYRDYLIQALKEYRDGGRKNAIMSGQVSNLSDAQIKVLAIYVSDLPGPLKMLPKPDF